MDPQKKKELVKQHFRAEKNAHIKIISDKKHKGEFRKQEKHAREAAEKAALADYLLTQDSGYLEAEGMERTFKFKQREIREHVDMATQAKMFSLDLDTFGPYNVDYTRNGTHLLIGGKKGHIATFNWREAKLGCEVQVGESVRDVKWLHNETMFAVAQKNYTFIYDNSGAELHCLKKHTEVQRLEFLPYHFLLASIGNTGYLKYQDVSTGKIVAEIRTGMGRCDVMRQNPQNAILHMGHPNGTVTLWSPNVTTPLVKMLCHKGPVKALAIDHSGTYMATSGLDGQMKVWDIRNYKCLFEYFTPTPAHSLDISQRGLLAVGYGPNVSIWKDAFTTKAQSPYMNHLHPSTVVHDLHFCPFEDVLGYGHEKGFATLIVPGSGEANYDSLELNPFQTKKQRQETEIRQLLEKIQPEMIALDPSFVGQVAPTEQIRATQLQRKEDSANEFKPKHKKRGKSSALKRYMRKQGNVIDAKREALKEKIEAQKRKKEMQAKIRNGEVEEPKYDALDRFSQKKKRVV